MHIMQLVSGKRAMNGAMVHVVQLCERLAQRGHKITLVCRPNSGVLKYVADMPIEIITSMQHRWPTDELRRIAKIIREQEVDILHAHMSRSQFFGVLLKYMTGVPCVATSHCQAMKGHRMLNDYVISNSAANRRIQMFKNLVRPSQVETVYYPVDIVCNEPPPPESRYEVRRSFGVADDTPLVGLVGNICPRKGHDVLIRTLPNLLKKHPRLRVAMIGNPFEDYAERYHQLAERLGVTDAVLWPGFRRDIPQVMSALDICVAPSRCEAFGLTAVEALAVGTPVIASRVGGLPETVEHERNGLVIPPGRPRALEVAIDRMLSDHEFYARCKSVARQSMRDKYEPEPLWNRIEEILVEVASRKPRRKLAA